MAEAVVYRVEHHRTGEGPYRAGDRSISHPYDQRHPIPQEDGDMMDRVSDVERATGKRLISRSWMDEPATGRFGFPSLSAFRTWFDRGLRERLASEGFVIREYYVPADHVAATAVQAIFLPDQSRKGVVYPVIMGQPLPTDEEEF